MVIELLSGETWADSYSYEVQATRSRLACEARTLHVPKEIPYLAPRHLLFLKDSSIHTIYPIVLSVGLSIHIPTSQLQYFDFGVHKVGPCTRWPERISHTFLVIARTFVRNLYLRRLYSLFMRTQANITISCICLQLDAEALYHH